MAARWRGQLAVDLLPFPTPALPLQGSSPAPAPPPALTLPGLGLKGSQAGSLSGL